jgi:hypothetical protein
LPRAGLFAGEKGDFFMGWEEVDEKIRAAQDSYFISCDTPDEFGFVIKAVQEQFPQLGQDCIETAVLACRDAVSFPRSRRLFLECLKQRMGV